MNVERIGRNHIPYWSFTVWIMTSFTKVIIVNWLQKGHKCIIVTLQEKQFCALISFEFHFFLIFHVFHKYLDTWVETCIMAQYAPFYFLLFISVKNKISLKSHLRPLCIHMTSWLCSGIYDESFVLLCCFQTRGVLIYLVIPGCAAPMGRFFTRNLWTWVSFSTKIPLSMGCFSE